MIGYQVRTQKLKMSVKFAHSTHKKKIWQSVVVVVTILIISIKKQASRTRIVVCYVFSLRILLLYIYVYKRRGGQFLFIFRGNLPTFWFTCSHVVIGCTVDLYKVVLTFSLMFVDHSREFSFAMAAFPCINRFCISLWQVPSWLIIRIRYLHSLHNFIIPLSRDISVGVSPMLKCSVSFKLIFSPHLSYSSISSLVIKD